MFMLHSNLNNYNSQTSLKSLYKLLRMGGCVSIEKENNVMTATAQVRKKQMDRIKIQIQKKNQLIQRLERQNTSLKTENKIATDNQSENIIQMDSVPQQKKAYQPETQLRSLLKCTLCEEDYNLKNRIPLMVCANQHTYCSECINLMINKRKDLCPECRVKINPSNQNRHLCSLLKNIDGKDFNTKSVARFGNNLEKYEMIPISISNSNLFLNQYTYDPVNGSLIKINQNSWYGLMCNQVIPVSGCFYFTLEVIFSKYNNIEIGLIDLNSKIQKGKMSNKRISYHLYDGKLLDSGSVQNPITKWREGGKKALTGGSLKLKVYINMDNNQIKWYCNNQLVCQTVVSNYIKYSKSVPYISMYHEGDVISLNQ